MNKKHLLALLLAVAMVSNITGCGLADKVAETIVASKEAPETEGTEEKTEAATEEATTGEAETKQETKERLTGTPVFGDTDIDYDGYAYLEAVDIENEDGEEMTVFIPMADYNYVNDTSADAAAMGVSITVEAAPYLQYDAKNYTVDENLEYLVESSFDKFYHPEYKDLEINYSASGENWAKCDITYIDKDYSDEYHVFCETYYLIETKKNSYVTVEIQVSKEDVTGKTADLIMELESFYQFDVNWDADAAQAKEDAFKADPEAFPNMFSVDDLLFELPAEWDEDNDYGEYDEHYFAPFGSVSLANSFVQITSEYSSDSAKTLEALAANPAQAEEIFKSMYPDMVDSITAKKYDDTCLGTTILIEMTVSDGEDTVDLQEYMAASNGCLYVISAGSYQGDTTGFEVAQDILANGEVREY